MSIQKITTAGSGFTSRLLKNKTVLKGLEKISEHGISFQAGVSVLMAAGVRPAVIYLTPDVEKENKQYSMASSISSGLVKFATVEAIAIPIEKAIKNIDKNPGKYLNKTALKKISDHKVYNFMTQILKQSTGLLTAIPKSVLTIALIPVITDNMFFKNKHKERKQQTGNNAKPTPTFTGKITDELSKGIGKILENEKFTEFAIKNKPHERDIAKHTTAATDVLLTASFAQQTAKSDKIKENRKKVLILNNFISTAVTLLGGYGLDLLAKEKSDNLIEALKKANPSDPKIGKYVEGINILRPALIFAGIYYGILPIFSTWSSEKLAKYFDNKDKS